MPNELQIQEKNPITEKRRNHCPAVGDIYYSNDYHYAQFYRLDKELTYKSDGKEYRHFEVSEFCPEEGRFIKADRSVIGESELLEHYKLCLQDITVICEDAMKIYNGDAPSYVEEEMLSTDTADTQALVAGSDERNLNSMLMKSQMLEDRITTTKAMLQVRINALKNALEEKRNKVEETLKIVQRQCSNIARALSILKTYLGEDVSIRRIAEGEPAPAGIPITIRQRILFMDEEMAVLGREGKGIDWQDRGLFEEWLKEPSHRDVIVPEAKCVVVCKPRRYDYKYCSNDPLTQEIMNRRNRQSFIVIRNGERIHAVDSENLWIYGSAIPTKKNYEAIASEMEHFAASAQRSLDNLNYRTYLYGSILQGLVDRTDIFNPKDDTGINILKGIGVNLVFDDENDNLLGTGRVPFSQWIAEAARKIRRGSRIVYVQGFSRGKHAKFYLHDYSKPPVPQTGIYSVEETGLKDTFSGTEMMSFLYQPGDNVWDEYGSHERRYRERWKFYPNTVINYDDLNLEELEEYLKDRSQRKDYMEFLPLLLAIRKQRTAERENERLFIDCLLRERGLENVTRRQAEDAVTWWKNKVIFQRPLSLDDNKAFRMIKKKLQNQQQS